jgi:hypothetical protein
MRLPVLPAVLTSGVVFLATSAPAFAAGTQFWNLTANTIVNFSLAPAGTDHFGKNQCENDHDASVDHDERLKITGVESGSYDARLVDSKGRTCVVKALAIKSGKVFSIEEGELKSCTP